MCVLLISSFSLALKGSMIQVSNLTKTFNGIKAVKGVSFSVEKGENLILLGTSGSGKTTTLKMINAIIKKDSGEVFINGANIDSLDHHELRRGIGYVIQNVGLFPHYTIAQNVGIVPQILNWSKQKILSRTEELLELVGLDKTMMQRKPHELSGGQQQRVGIARALAADPDVILLDEPFGALDPITRNEIQQEFKNLEGVLNKTMVMVTHDVKEACILGNRICLMDEGEIQQMGTPRELVFKPANDFVRSFIGKNAFELELLVIKLSDLSPFFTNKNVDNDHALLSDNLTLQEVIDKGPEDSSYNVNINGDLYSFKVSEVLKLYFVHRSQIIANI